MNIINLNQLKKIVYDITDRIYKITFTVLSLLVIGSLWKLLSWKVISARLLPPLSGVLAGILPGVDLANIKNAVYISYTNVVEINELDGSLFIIY